jgi:hypothetical protein
MPLKLRGDLLGANGLTNRPHRRQTVSPLRVPEHPFGLIDGCRDHIRLAIADQKRAVCATPLYRVVRLRIHQHIGPNSRRIEAFGVRPKRVTPGFGVHLAYGIMHIRAHHLGPNIVRNCQTILAGRLYRMDQSRRQRAIALLSKIAKVQAVTRWGKAKVRIGMMIKAHHRRFGVVDALRFDDRLGLSQKAGDLNQNARPSGRAGHCVDRSLTQQVSPDRDP